MKKRYSFLWKKFSFPWWYICSGIYAQILIFCEICFSFSFFHFYFFYLSTIGWWKHRNPSRFSISSFHLIFTFWGPLSLKRCFLKIGLYVCMFFFTYAWLSGEFSVFYISKINKDRNTKFYAQYRLSVWIIFPGFGKNRKPDVGYGGLEMKLEVSILKTVQTIFFKLDI